MKEAEVRERAFAMPLTSPAFPRGPYRFCQREYLIIEYRTDLENLQAVVPEPLEVYEPVVKYEFIRMPDSTGFGDYTETGQVIPVSFRGRKGSYSHCMFLNDDPPIAGGRELWGFPKKLAQPSLRAEIDTLVGTLNYGPVCVATGTMGYKHKAADLAAIRAALEAPNFLLKIIPHVDGTPRICELVEYYLEDITLKGAWTGPGALDLHAHALAPVAELPVREVISATHIIADLTLGLGKVVYDYLEQKIAPSLEHRMQPKTKITIASGAASGVGNGGAGESPMNARPCTGRHAQPGELESLTRVAASPRRGSKFVLSLRR